MRHRAARWEKCSLSISTRISRATSTGRWRYQSNNKVVNGPVLADMERRAVERREFKSGNYAPFVTCAKAALTESFKDPSSVQYQGLFVAGTVMPVLCGQVNGKNSYGGYVGYRRFYATGLPSLNDVENPRENSVFKTMWPSMCGQKVADVP
jgi:hypothetical protein